MKKLLLLLFALFIGVASSAQTEYFVIKNYSVKVRFTEKGYADFDETIEVLFSEPRHGIFRNIPLRSNINGRSVKRVIKDIEVDGGPFSQSRAGDDWELKIGSKNELVNGAHTYRIRYRITNPLNFFDDHIEFYWDLLGTSWKTSTEHFEYQVLFPNRIQLGANDAFIYTGSRGAQNADATISQEGNGYSGHSLKGFAPGEAITLAVRLPKDAYKELSFWENLLENHPLWLAPFLFIGFGIYSVFKVRNRKETIVTEYFPPKGISPSVAGGFVDHSVDSNDILCLIPHLANKGLLRLETEEGGFWSKDKVWFVKLREPEASELENFELKFFNALFSYGDRVLLSDLKDKFYTHISDIRSDVKAWIDAQGWYDKGQNKWLGYVIGAGVLALISGAIILFTGNTDGLVLLVTAFVVFFFTIFFRKRSNEGNEIYRQLEGFRQFVKKAEKPVIERLLKDDPKYYDKTMAYVLAFGYLKRWNQQFEGLLSEPPSWYSGPGGIRTAGMYNSWSSFSENFPSEVDNIGSVFSSSPSSSGSGGGGGGFSGGGSGGGGGGSW